MHESLNYFAPCPSMSPYCPSSLHCVSLRILHSSPPPHALQVLQHRPVGVHEAVHAVAHARLLVPVQARLADLGDALAEADVGQIVNSCNMSASANASRDRQKKKRTGLQPSLLTLSHGKLLQVLPLGGAEL